MENRMQVEVKIGESKQSGHVYIFVDGIRMNIQFGSVHQAENYLCHHLKMIVGCGIFAGSN